MVFSLEAFEGIKALATPLIQPLFIQLLYFLLQSAATISSIWQKGDRLQDEADSQNLRVQKTYDFVIVGAGSAGTLLANRLSRNYSVLLLEAGGEPNPLQFIPRFAFAFLNYPEIDWMFRTVPQKYASLNSVNQVVQVPNRNPLPPKNE